MMSPFDVLPQLSSARCHGSIVKPWKRVHTDSRNVEAGDFFVALKGDRLDGHDFLNEVLKVDVAGIMTSKPIEGAGAVPWVWVPDTAQALRQWAQQWREQVNPLTIAVTGSNGKTTVTQMIACILKQAYPQTMHATEGNLNNHWGVPLTLLRLREYDEISVVELGMNHPGEIQGLAQMVQPRVALINNAQREHQEFMKDVDAVALENSKVFEALRADGVAVFSADEAYATMWREGLRQHRPDVKCLTFSLQAAGSGAHVQLKSAHWQEGAWQIEVETLQGALSIVLHMAGQHNIHNALAAITCALAAKVPLQAIEQGLSCFVPVSGRSQLFMVSGWDDLKYVVDDTYNANPDSVLAAIDVLKDLPAPRHLILGDMGEVGDEQGLIFHQEVMAYALKAGIENIDVTGRWMSQAVANWSALDFGGISCSAINVHDSVEALLSFLLQKEKTACSVLVKGSRFMRMERVVKALLSACATKTQGEKIC